ncbi:MAG: creatininase family protein [Opitutales bacterium]
MSGPRWGRYSDLRPTEIEAMRELCPIAYLPWGALEWHSQHAPIGLDSVKAEGICVALAERTGGVVLPAIPMGVNTIKPFKGFPHSIDISAGLATGVAAEFCAQLAEEGFRLVVLFTGHYPPEQFTALQAGVDRVASSYPETQFVVWADNLFLGDAFAADHAGATETSFQMHFAPGSVDLEALPSRAVTLDDDGITGEDPRVASAERGARQLAVVLEKATAKIASLTAAWKEAS